MVCKSARCIERENLHQFYFKHPFRQQQRSPPAAMCLLHPTHTRRDGQKKRKNTLTFSALKITVLTDVTLHNHEFMTQRFDRHLLTPKLDNNFSFSFPTRWIFSNYFRFLFWKNKNKPIAVAFQADISYVCALITHHQRHILKIDSFPNE
jgi:hypothetical protein